MGDRNNPIKFGPEWLRNLARERSAATSASNSQNAGSGSGGGTGPGVAGPSGGNTSSSTPRNFPPHPHITSKVLLAKLRYGREEMLALYDKNAEAPPELKTIDVLYQPRGKPPSALNNTFEEETRENIRSAPPIGGLSPGERFGVGRGIGRGLGITETRGRARGAFIRQLSTGRGTAWQMGSPRMPVYSGGADEDTSSLRSWNNTNPLNTVSNRNSGEQTDWQSTKMFRNKRPGSNTNWRQSTRDDGDEWRSDTARSRPQDKWDRDWGDRPTQDKQSWNSNRRTWVGGDAHNNEENLPEWAVDNAEACGGTFDSSGAFHGYSNDDSNLPKNQDSGYALTRSHTHGSFVRQKTAEEGSEEWWASEKAKKLSPKRFDAGDIKFKKTPTTNPSETGAGSSANKHAGNRDEIQDIPEKLVESNVNDSPNSLSGGDDKYNKSTHKQKFTESKTFDALMRSDINMEDANDDRGNFQSVMIASNNSLRQKHQNMVQPIHETLGKPNRKPGILRLPRTSSTQSNDAGQDKSHNTPEEKFVEDMFEMALEEKEMLPKLPSSTSNSLLNATNSSSSVMPASLSTNAYSRAQMPNPMQMGMSSPGLPGQGLSMNQNSKPIMPAPGIQPPMQQNVMQPVGITNSALNASLGLPLGGPNLGMPLQGVPPPVMPNTGMTNPVLASSPMQQNMGSSGMQACFQSSTGVPGMSTPNVGNNSLFLGQNSNNSTQLQSPNDIQMPNHSGQTNLFPMHGLQHAGAQAAFGNSFYGNMMQQTAAQPPSSAHSLADQWYYEDPKKIIQGPFSSKEMYNWYRAGFFSPSLMVRRACDAMMRPLGTYGPIVPFAQMDMMPYPMSGGGHDNMLNSQQGLGLDVMNMPNMNMSDGSSVDPIQFGSVGIMRNPPYGQTQMVDSLWSQPASSADLMWMQHAMNSRNDNRVNNLSMFFWDQQPSAIASNSLLPEGLPKEMKTEDQILAQLRASQNIGSPQTLPFMADQPATPTATTKPDDGFTPSVNATTPNLEELQKLIQKDTLVSSPPVSESSDSSEQMKQENPTNFELNLSEPNVVKQQPVPSKPAELKPAKQSKSETDKVAKNKETNSTKNKSKKLKDDKKDEPVEVKTKEKENDVKVEKRSAESSPSKSKKEDKVNKKELDKEKKEWIKEGFTIVKGPEKNVKDIKKKVEEAKAAEETERKRREEEKLAVDEEKKKKQAESLKKQQEQQQQQQQRQASESVVKKAPWSAVSNQAMQATNKDGLTLAEIQRLEREKKLEQMKEQQHMMQIIAQQQAAALAREQEMQAGLGWAKKKGANLNSPGQSLAEIQAEARKQAAAAAAAAASAQAMEEVPVAPTPQMNHVPWVNSHNGGGFWDTQPNQPSKPEKPQEAPKTPEPIKIKKKVTVNTPVKKETSPVVDFENWCTIMLSSWSSKIDVPTFVGFLKDIESPYEVKDYVKCYLGESKDCGDFARQFLERRSKLLRVGMVTPSDDLCSPAIAVNPRTTSTSDYQEVKGKGKKTKKNKMLKVDARILGFSVTAAEDRINVGDIDTV